MSLALSSSWIVPQLNKITGPLSQLNQEGTATTSDIAHEDMQRECLKMPEYEQLKAGEEQDRFEYELHKAGNKENLRTCDDSEVTLGVETG